MKPTPPDFSAMLCAVTAAPIEAQMLMDAQWEADAARWMNLAAWFVVRMPPSCAWRTEFFALLAATAPVRQVVQRYELDWRMRVRVERALSVSIEARPIDLGFEMVFGSMREAAARVVVEVEAVPLPAAPSVTADLADWTDVPFPPLDGGAR